MKQIFVAKKGTQLPKLIDLQSSDLVPLAQCGWIDSNGKELLIYSTNSKDAGSYMIVQVLQVNKFPQVTPYSSFYLEIEYDAGNINLTPKVRNVEFQYVIGETNDPINLKKFYNLPILNKPYTVLFSFEYKAGLMIPSA